MTSNKKIQEAPCCSHPFSVCLVDDNFSHLLDTLGGLDNRLFHYQMSQWPERLLPTLNKQYGNDPFIHRNMQQVPISGSGYQHIDVLTSYIHQEVKRLARFEQVGIVLLDVEMPALNGLEMCDRLTNPYMQKIALTGKLSKDDAIAALNEGRVHQVIYKEDNNLQELLPKVLQRAYWNYYAALTQGLYGSNSPYDAGSAPRDSRFFDLLTQQMQQHNAVEHYLMPNRCRYTKATNRCFMRAPPPPCACRVWCLFVLTNNPLMPWVLSLADEPHGLQCHETA